MMLPRFKQFWSKAIRKLEQRGVQTHTWMQTCRKTSFFSWSSCFRIKEDISIQKCPLVSSVNMNAIVFRNSSDFLVYHFVQQRITQIVFSFFLFSILQIKPSV